MADDVNDAGVVLGRIEGKLDNFALQLNYEKERGTDHERRLRTVEKWMYALPIALIVSVGNVALYFTGR